MKFILDSQNLIWERKMESLSANRDDEEIENVTVSDLIEKYNIIDQRGEIRVNRCFQLWRSTQFQTSILIRDDLLQYLNRSGTPYKRYATIMEEKLFFVP